MAEITKYDTSYHRAPQCLLFLSTLSNPISTQCQPHQSDGRTEPSPPLRYRRRPRSAHMAAHLAHFPLIRACLAMRHMRAFFHATTTADLAFFRSPIERLLPEKGCGVPFRLSVAPLLPLAPQTTLPFSRQERPEPLSWSHATAYGRQIRYPPLICRSFCPAVRAADSRCGTH